MFFCNFLEIKAETKKLVGVKVVSFRILYSCVKFRRLKMGDPVYKLHGNKDEKFTSRSIIIAKQMKRLKKIRVYTTA